MKAVREFEGADLDEALRVASEALDRSVGELEYRVVEEGRRGVFGLGARSVRISVDIPGRPRAGRTKPPSRASAGAAGAVRPEPAEPDAEVRRWVGDTARRMIELMGLDLEVRTESGEHGLFVDLRGPDSGAFREMDGQLLSALRFVLNRMARKQWQAAGRVDVRCEGFRDRHDTEVIELAREVASQVARTGQPRKLEAMNPYDRRLVHLTVGEFPGLTTCSAGSGFLKRIIVSSGTDLSSQRE